MIKIEIENEDKDVILMSYYLNQLNVARDVPILDSLVGTLKECCPEQKVISFPCDLCSLRFVNKKDTIEYLSFCQKEIEQLLLELKREK